VADEGQAQTLMFALGAPLRGVQRPLLTLGAVQLPTRHGAGAAASSAGGGADGAATEDSLYLLPVWHRRRLAMPTAASRPPSHGAATIYNGLGSGVFYANACDRLRCDLAAATAATAAGAAGYGSGYGSGGGGGSGGGDAVILNAGPPERRVQMVVKNPRFLEEALSYAYGSDEMLGPPPSQIAEVLTPRQLHTAATRLQGSGAVKAYPDGDATRAPPDRGLAGRFSGDFLRRVRARILGGGSSDGGGGGSVGGGGSSDGGGGGSTSTTSHDARDSRDSERTHVPGFGPTARIRN